MSMLFKTHPAVSVFVLWLACLFNPWSLAAQSSEDLADLDVIPAKSGGWVFAVGQTPRLVWRDVEIATAWGLPSKVAVRWFDRQLREAPAPDEHGRWLAVVDATTKDGLPFRRAYTCLAVSPQLDRNLAPDLTLAFPNFQQPQTWPGWQEHRGEIEKLANEILLRGLLENPKSAVLLANISESPVRHRPALFLESAAVTNARVHLSLQRKLYPDLFLGKNLEAPRRQPNFAPVISIPLAEDESVDNPAKIAIDEYCQRWQQATQEPFVILIAQGGQVITHAAFGQDASGQPIPLDYRCWIASLTKTVTALLVAQFLDQKRCTLDTPLNQIFREFPPEPANVPTLRQLLNHTSGLSGGQDFGGMLQPHLENRVLLGIRDLQPGNSYAYSGLGFELTAKAMERLSGVIANDLYQTQLFEPLKFGDVVLGNAGSDCHLTALELAVLGQLLLNRGSYGDLQFFSPETFDQLLPRPLGLTATEEYGVGMHWIRHPKRGRPAKSTDPHDWVFSAKTIGHGSMSGCILIVDLERQLVIVQVRRAFRDADNAWWSDFFPTIIEAVEEIRIQTSDFRLQGLTP